jgi:TetR/AcrR family transcriptional repressor of lmrAB and yxaGH operons
LIVSAYEGALLQARVAGSVQAMRDTSEALVGLLRLALGQRSTPDA